MRILLWFFRLAIFLLLLAFAIKNDGLVRVQAFLDSSWNVPLVVVMLASFIVGLLLGAVSLVSTILSLRRELAAVKKTQQHLPLPAITPTRLRGQFSDMPDSF